MLVEDEQDADVDFEGAPANESDRGENLVFVGRKKFVVKRIVEMRPARKTRSKRDVPWEYRAQTACGQLIWVSARNFNCGHLLWRFKRAMETKSRRQGPPVEGEVAEVEQVRANAGEEVEIMVEREASNPAGVSEGLPVPRI